MVYIYFLAKQNVQLTLVSYSKSQIIPSVPFTILSMFHIILMFDYKMMAATLSIATCKTRSAWQRWRREGSKWICPLHLPFIRRTHPFSLLYSLVNDQAIYFPPQASLAKIRTFWPFLDTKEAGQTSKRSSERDLSAGSMLLSWLL